MLKLLATNRNDMKSLPSFYNSTQFLIRIRNTANYNVSGQNQIQCFI